MLNTIDNKMGRLKLYWTKLHQTVKEKLIFAVM